MTKANTDVSITYLNNSTVVNTFNVGTQAGDVETINADGSGRYNWASGDTKVTDAVGSYVITYINQDPIKTIEYFAIDPSVDVADQGYTVTNYLNGDVKRVKDGITTFIFATHIEDTMQISDPANKKTTYKRSNGTTFTEYLNSDPRTDMKKTVYTNSTVTIENVYENLDTPANSYTTLYTYLNGTSILFDRTTQKRTTTFSTNSTKVETFINGTNIVTNPKQSDPQMLDVYKEIVNANQFRYRTFLNGTTVKIDAEVFIYNGCWKAEEDCVNHKCYPPNQKCNCVEGENKVCKTVGGENTCVENNDCSVCPKWCKNIVPVTGSEYVICIDEPQETANENDTCSPVCHDKEICINGKCIYKGEPCYWQFDVGRVGVFCFDDEECINETCYKTCKRDCEKKETCFADQSVPQPDPNFQVFGKCVINTEQDIKHVIDTCTIIQNCRDGEKLNECDQCMDGFSFKREIVSETVVIHKKQCVQTVVNCKYGKEDSNNPGTYVCDPFTDTLDPKDNGCYAGYKLSNGQCIDETEACKSYDDFGNCNWCSDNYSNEGRYAIRGFFDLGECIAFPIADPSLSENQTKNTNKDVNCKNFYYKVNLPPTGSSINKLKNGLNICIECKEGYFLNNQDQCLEKTIAFCGVYELTSTVGNITCESCELGSRVVGSNCIDNTPTEEIQLIPKCLKYDVTKSCVVCDVKYIPRIAATNSEGQNKFCFKDVKDSGCAENDIEYFKTTGNIRCKKCDLIQNKSAYPLIISNPNRICVDIPYYPNCIKHKVNMLNDSTLDCLECSSLYFLEIHDNSQTKKVCKQRNNAEIPGCIKYFIDQDACEELESSGTGETSSTIVLSADVEVLLNNPPPSIEKDMVVDFAGWIMGCDVYLDEQNCEKCFPPKYKNPYGFEYNTKCITVQKEIDYCKYYGDDGRTCEECKMFFTLIQGECRLTKVVNCKEYHNELSCKSCPDIYPFLDEDGNCSKHPLNPWCLHYNYYEGKVVELDIFIDCNICEEDYYPDNLGLCKVLENKIENCKYYNSNNLCRICDEGTYLKYNGKECITNPAFDENCSEFGYNTECSICEFQYYLKDGKCIKCGATLEIGCAFCDPENTAYCLVCKPGYTFNKENICLETFEGSGEKRYIRKFSYNLREVTSGLLGSKSLGVIYDLTYFVLLVLYYFS